MNAESYARALKKLLPPGALWCLDAVSKLSSSFLAVGDELVRADARGTMLIEETDPRTATETLGDWETMLGLPDADVATIPATTAARRLAVTQKYVRQGGQNAAYYISLAHACGWTIYVGDGYDQTVFRAGRGRCGDRLYGPSWSFVWRVDVDFAAPVALTNVELEAIIRRVAPAHTVVVFNYL